MNRRELLVAAAGAAAALRAPGAFATSRRRVVVVGAGLAGLVCATELRRAGLDVVVLEGRSVAGGRVRTIRGVFQDGQHAEAGGELLHPSDRELRRYVARLGLGLERVAPAAPVVFYRDRRRSLPPAVERDVRRFRAAVAELARRPAATFDREPASALLDRLRLGREARFLVAHELRQEFAVEPRQLSLLHLVTTPPANGPAYRIAGGADGLVDALVRPLGGSLRLGTTVSHVEWHPDGVAVHAGGHRYEGDACVLAVPLPPLRDVRFDPALPARLSAAIEQLQYGRGTKTLVQYDRRFWWARGDSGSVVADLTFQRSWDAAARQPGPRGILAFFAPGRFGDAYAKVGKGTRVVLAAGELDDVYPGSLGLQERGSSSAWETEDLSGGTFVAYAPGQVTRFREVLRRPVGPLHLAGEHADDRSGTMEGAVRSGRRVAALVAARVAR